MKKRREKKKISIIWKITLWYTLFLSLLAVIVVSVIYLVSERIIVTTSKNYLINAVEDVVDEIEYNDGVLEVDDDIDFLDRGVYISIYDDEYDLLFGLVPKEYENGLVEPINISEKELIHIKDWYQYESHKDVEGYGEIIIRGMVKATMGDNLLVTIQVLMVLSPIIILIATVGGYALTKQAFKPIHQMRKTVECISSGKDLTKRVNLGEGEDELHMLGKTFDQMFERLEEAFEKEKQFSSDVSHELRTPVSVILSQCEYALEQNNGIETNEALQSIHQQTKRMSKMIGQLLLMSRNEHVETNFPVENIMISELLEVIVEEEREKAKQKNITIDTDIEEGIVLQGDELLLVRFFINLISNAISYGKENGIVKVVLKQEDGKVNGRIEDNGIGIAPENQKKIWRRFYQVNPSRTSTDENNLGLGLSMVQYIANIYRAEVWVESELGVGTTFYFSFPN